jgi:hypothetical protein
MGRETRVVREIDGGDGTLTDKAGVTVQVRFSLTQTQDFIDGIPAVRSAEGSLEFKNISDAWAMLRSPETKTLRGGGIQAEVIVETAESFEVIGSVEDI